MQVLLSPRIGGAESLAANLDSEWRDRGVRSKIVYLDPDNSDDSGSLARIRRLRSVTKAFRPDVILSHSAYPNVFSRMIAPKGTPAFPVLHSSANDYDNLKLRSAERLLRLRTPAVVSVSGIAATEYRFRFGGGVPVYTIANGIRADLPERAASVLAPKKVVSIARVSAVKRPDLWASVAALATLNAPEMSFEWFGSADPGDEATSAMIDAHQNAGNPGTFMGITSDPGTVLQESDIFFHSADRESQCLGALEAAAVGVPVVCSDAVADVLPDGLPSAVFKAGNSMDALDALLHVGSNWQAASANAVAWAPRVRQMFSLRVCADRYLELFSEHLRKQPC